jgi:mRNA interferase RelE/StbE
MEYCFKPSAIRDLKKLPRSIQRRIFNKLNFYFKSTSFLKFAEPLRDKTLGDFRFRIGDYRVIFDVDFKREIAIILAIGHRRDIYK